MRTRWGFLEAAVLALTGLGMGLTALGQEYWLLLNPKFRPLTLAAAAGCLLAGLALLLRAKARPRFWRVALFAAFLGCLALFHIQSAGPDQMDGAFPPPAGLSGDNLAPDEPGASRLTLGGREYVRLNTAELASLAAGQELEAGGRFATRGLVLTSPELSAQGLYGLVRVQIVCCLADAVAVGVLVRGEPPVGDQEWARVAGRAVATGSLADGLEPLVSSLSLPGMLLTYVETGFVLDAERAETTEPPAMPYIFEVRDAEPFAF